MQESFRQECLAAQAGSLQQQERTAWKPWPVPLAGDLAQAAPVLAIPSGLAMSSGAMNSGVPQGSAGCRKNTARLKSISLMGASLALHSHSCFSVEAHINISNSMANMRSTLAAPGAHDSAACILSHASCLCHGHWAQRLCPCICGTGPAPAGKKDVFGLDVGVADAQGVQVGQGQQQLPRDAGCLKLRQGLHCAAPGCQLPSIHVLCPPTAQQQPSALVRQAARMAVSGGLLWCMRIASCLWPILDHCIPE